MGMSTLAAAALLLAVLAGLAASRRTAACQMLVPAELLNACTFDQLQLTEPRTGFTVDLDTCNDVVDKEAFVEQPYVYFAGADDVRV